MRPISHKIFAPWPRLAYVTLPVIASVYSLFLRPPYTMLRVERNGMMDVFVNSRHFSSLLRRLFYTLGERRLS